MRMLAGLLMEEKRREDNEAYTAQMMWYLNRAAYGREFRHPSWIDMIDKKEMDERTGQEIVDDVAMTIRKRIERRQRERR